jgi:SnoaL-like protein
MSLTRRRARRVVRQGAALMGGPSPFAGLASGCRSGHDGEVDRSDVAAWVDRYVEAWGSNAPDQIGALFSDDARYYTAPHRQAWTGREAIVREWLNRKDQPGEWSFRYEVLGVDGSVGFVRGWTTHHTDGPASNLWVIRLDEDGRCTEFIEWWMGVDG